MIGSTLTDVGGLGPYYYGGLIVYDTDAKRLWANVRTPNLYNEETAKQMAEGALKNSRATVALSITGNAASAATQLGCLGIADVGLAYYTEPDRIETITERIDGCSDEIIKDRCSKWVEAYGNDKKASLRESATQPVPPNFPSGKYPDLTDTLEVNQLIRLALTGKALQFAIDTLNKANLPREDVALLGPRKSPQVVEDEVKYLGCWEPSDPIWNRLQDTYKANLLSEAKATGVVPAGATKENVRNDKGHNKVFGQICALDNNPTAVAARKESMCPVDVDTVNSNLFAAATANIITDQLLDEEQTPVDAAIQRNLSEFGKPPDGGRRTKRRRRNKVIKSRKHKQKKQQNKKTRKHKQKKQQNKKTRKH